MGKSCVCWYVIRASEYLCRLHTSLVSPCVSIHVFTSDDSLFQSLIRMICPSWCIHLEISVLRSIQNWVLGPFWIFMTTRASNCLILVITLFFPCSIIHDKWPRFLNYLPVAITLHDTSSTTMIAVPTLLNGPLEMVTWLYPVLILLVFKHPSVLLYIFSFWGILLPLLFT